MGVALVLVLVAAGGLILVEKLSGKSGSTVAGGVEVPWYVLNAAPPGGPDSNIATYKAELWTYVLQRPEVAAELSTWKKDKIIAIVHKLIPDNKVAAIMLGIIEHESGFHPWALAGYPMSGPYLHPLLPVSDWASNSTAFGVGQVVRKTHKGLDLGFPHYALWYPPLGVTSAYAALLYHGLGKTTDKEALKGYSGGNGEYAATVAKLAKKYA